MNIYVPIIIIDVIIQNFNEEFQKKSLNTVDTILSCYESYQKIEKALEKYLLVHFGSQQVLMIMVLFISISSFLNNELPTTALAAEFYRLVGHIFQMLGLKTMKF